MKHHYTDDTRGLTLAILDANGGNVTKTARHTSVPAATIRDWRNQNRPHITQIRDLKKRLLADELERLAINLLDTLPAKIHDATLQQAATSLGIMIDRMLLLRTTTTSG